MTLFFRLLAGVPTAGLETGDQVRDDLAFVEPLRRAFYGEEPKRSYFSSCSNGGRQALMEAQRYPADYDGIIAGAPAAHFTRITAAFDWDLQAMAVDPASHIPPRKMPAIEAAALAACDALDGVKDGVIDDPNRCTFSPAVLRCTGPESDSCLTEPQIARSDSMRAPNLRGEPVFPGRRRVLKPGRVDGLGGWPRPRQTEPAVAFASQAGLTCCIGPRLQLPDLQSTATCVSGICCYQSDLSAFKRRGGKLILYHGWSDAALPPMGTVSNTKRHRENELKCDGFRSSLHDARCATLRPGRKRVGNMPAKQGSARERVSALERWWRTASRRGAIIATKYKTNGLPASGVLRVRWPVSANRAVQGKRQHG